MHSGFLISLFFLLSLGWVIGDHGYFGRKEEVIMVEDNFYSGVFREFIKIKNFLKGLFIFQWMEV